MTTAAASNAAGGEDNASLGSIVTEAVAEERRIRQGEIQKGVIQLLNGKVEEAVLLTSKTDVLTYFRLDCHRAWTRFQVHSWSVPLNWMRPRFCSALLHRQPEDAPAWFRDRYDTTESFTWCFLAFRSLQGSFFPEGIRASDSLSQYCCRFSVVENNILESHAKRLWGFTLTTHETSLQRFSHWWWRASWEGERHASLILFRGLDQIQ